MSNQRLSVLLEDPSELAVSLSEVAAVLAEALDVPLPDATQRARYSGGLLVRSVSELRARQIQKGLASAGLSAFLVSDEDLTPAPRPRRLGRLLVDAQGLHVLPFMQTGETTLVPWEDVLAVEAWALRQQSPSDDLRDALPKRGGTLARLSPDTRRVLEELRIHETRERVVIQLGIDLLVSGPRLFRLRVDDPGIYAALEPDRSDGEAIEVAFTDLAGFVLGSESGPDWSGFRGSYVEWEGVVCAVNGEAGTIEVRPERKAPQGVLVTMRDPADLRERDVSVGQVVGYRGRLEECRKAEGLFTVSDGQFQSSSHSVGNYLSLVRKLVRTARGKAYVPKSSRRFADRADFTDVLFYKREEQDAINTWLIQAMAHGLGEEIAEVSDEELVDADEAILVDEGSDHDVEDVSEEEFDDVDDDELEDVDDDELEDDVTIDLDDIEEPEEFRGSALGVLSGLGSAAGDIDLASALEHIAGRSGRLSRTHIREMITAAESLESLEEDLLDALDEDDNKEAMSFFEMAKSGKWKLADILGADELEGLLEESDDTNRALGSEDAPQAGGEGGES